MAWHDQSWRESYDAWKLASPDDGYEDYDDYRDECDHGEYESDMLSGRAECDHCGYSWHLTDAEINAEIERQRQYHEWEERENRRQWWRDLFSPVLYPLSVIHWHLQKLKLRWRKSPVIEDDIPF